MYQNAQAAIIVKHIVPCIKKLNGRLYIASPIRKSKVRTNDIAAIKISWA